MTISRHDNLPREPPIDSATDSTPPDEPLETLNSFGEPEVPGGEPAITVGIGVMPTRERRPLTATSTPVLGCATRSAFENIPSLSRSKGELGRRPPLTASSSISQLVPPLSHGLVEGISVGNTTRPKRICGG